jgi:hypothetical protein
MGRWDEDGKTRKGHVEYVERERWRPNNVSYYVVRHRITLGKDQAQQIIVGDRRSKRDK